jgi:mannitol/fructose-specific phosphotransferase system IIA component (Ntr-type)
MIQNYINAGDITFDVHGRNSEEVIKGLLAHMYRQGRVKDLEDAVNVVIKRERVRPTGLQLGIAIPHGKTEKIKGAVMGIARLSEPVDFGALDGKPCNHVAIILVQREDGAPTHIATLQVISRPFLKESCVGRLDRAATPEEYFKYW